MKPFRIPPDRNAARCFSEQLLGSRHTVLETGANILLQIPALLKDRNLVGGAGVVSK